MHTPRRITVLAALAAGLLLPACALRPWVPSDTHPGDSRADVIRVMGPPSHVYAMPDGHARLEYNHMPFGKYTYMIDFGADDRETGWEQVLDEQHFAQVVAGMSMADVQRLIGPPSYTGHYLRPTPGNTWFYRWETYQRCILFEVAFDAATGLVLEGDYPPDPACPGEFGR